jgi:ribosome biogenesis SPOUT family RNA methylase Rps3
LARRRSVPQGIDDLRTSLIGGIMGDDRPIDQTRSRAGVREHRSPFFRRAAAPALLFRRQSGRRLKPEQLTSEEALDQAKAFARAARDTAS